MDVIVKGSPSIEISFEGKVADSYKAVDSALSTTSENPVQNKVVTEELGKKVNSSDLATINGLRIDEGGDIEIEGGMSEDEKAELNEKLTELSAKVNELDKGEAYIMGDTLTFRNYADAKIEGETLKL